jgi:hypothetical protein
MMNRFFTLVCMSMLSVIAGAQIDEYAEFKRQQMEKFAGFSSVQQAKYDAYRKALNEQYARFMEDSWMRLSAMPAVEIEEEPKIKPIVYDYKSTTKVEEGKIDSVLSSDAIFDFIPILLKKEVIQIPEPSPQAEPIAPIEGKLTPHEMVSVAFYGTMVSVPFPITSEWSIPLLDEKQLAKTWKALSASEYDITVRGVLDAREYLQLCDWGYMQMLQAICEQKYGRTNEATFMQAYLMAQSGYKIRLAYNEKLYMLVASEYNILSMFYFQVDGEKFYPINCSTRELAICKASFEEEQKISLQITKQQNLQTNTIKTRELSSKDGINVNVVHNQNVVDFYSNYPSSYIDGNVYTRWAVYANTPLDSLLVASLYPILTAAIEGLSEKDAVNKLLNFVQTAFEYEYDDRVWGEDRAFFAEETLYYPYADCEDRAVLFSRLVRDIIGLNVVLLYYPGHLAAAVEFNEEVLGDYLLYGNSKYIVCDPTYIGAPVGWTMPNMNNTEAQIIIL